MPCYDYSCTRCGNVHENIIHTISELENPSKEIIKEITCHCLKKGVRMELAYLVAPTIKTPTRNRLLNISRKKRNKDHFNKEILPDLEQDTKIHHLKKAGKKVNIKKMGLVG